MFRRFAFLAAALLLNACDQSPRQYESRYAPADAPAPADATAPAEGGFAYDGDTRGPQPQSGESYIYDHALTISMASEQIKARFERARDRCQNDAALKCKVTSASFRILGNPDAPLPVAYLGIALPHDGVAPFEASLLEPLPGENAADVIVQSRATTAQNVTQQVRDIDRRLAQLTDYRDRMTALAKRGNATTDDLIKIEGEISKTQSEIEQIDAQKRELAERIAKENMTITFQAQSTVGDAFQPVSDVWQSSLRILGESTAGAIAVMIGSLPWIPIILIVALLLRWLWRRTRRAKT